MKIVIIVLSSLVLLLAISLIIEKHKSKKMLNNLNNMLDLALDDDFSENTFDESLFSAIESKFYQFILKNIHLSQSFKKDKDNINKLISDISHQTKTPLSNIMIYTELLKELENSGSKDYISALNGQVSKLEFLIDSLIKASRLEANIIKITTQENSIKKLIEHTIENTLPKLKEKNIEITNNIDDYTAIFDMKWTTESLSNIVDNAIKYSSTNSKIIINTIKYNFFTCINITDFGIGVSQEETTKIFERFYRSADVSEIEGVGIGLYLSREIITVQGGYIKVSDNSGNGSVFSIYLPNKV